MIVKLGHEPLAEIPDVAEALESEALEILVALEEQVEALTSERDLAITRRYEALVAHGYEKQQKHRIEHEKARLQEQIDELETRARGDLATIDSQQGEITQLEEQVEALQQKLVKTRTEAEEYRELWHNAEG